MQVVKAEGLKKAPMTLGYNSKQKMSAFLKNHEGLHPPHPHPTPLQTIGLLQWKRVTVQPAQQQKH